MLLPLAVLAALVHSSHSSLHERRSQVPDDSDVLYLPPSGQLRSMSLGYNEVLGDLIWIRAVIFAGNTLGGQNFVWIERYLEAIFELAPSFRRPYSWGGVTTVYSGLTPTRESTARAIALYRRGLSHFPEDHEMLFALGMLLTRDVGSVPGFTSEEIEAGGREGASLIRKAASFGAPPLVRQLAATLVADDASDQLAIQFLETQLLLTQDNNYRRMLRAKLEALAGSANLKSVQRIRSTFKNEHAEHYPYISNDLYALIRDDTRG